MAEALCLKATRKVELAVPARGEKRAVVLHAETNAREALERKLAEGAGQVKLLEGVAQLFGLPAAPQRIECYDNSHIMGQAPYGVMVVAGPEGFTSRLLPQVRHQGPRRARRRLRHDARGAGAPLRPRAARARRPHDAAADWPDVVLIDGGAGQYSAARAVMDDLGVTDVTAGGHRQGRGPQRRPRVVPHRGQAPLPAPAARPGALLPPARARRDAPLRHHHPPRRPLPRPGALASSTRSTASAPPASARCSTTSAPRGA